ncbi:MAG: hypothetical protein Tsb0015_00350 [Simkaniaceae bacterium]
MIYAIVAALPSEAKSLIEHFRLKQVIGDHPFGIWKNERIHLIVSGVGKISSSAATAYLYKFLSRPADVWINFGIAGHPHLPIGQPVVPISIKDVAAEKTVYPILLTAPPCLTAPLHTVDKAEKTYRENVLYDMEGSGFFLAASKFLSLERISLFKIVSDNLQCHFGNITKKGVQEIISQQLPLFEKWIRSFPEDLDQKPVLNDESIFDNRRLTFSQKVKLKKIYEKILLLSQENPQEFQTKMRNLHDTELYSFLENYLETLLRKKISGRSDFNEDRNFRNQEEDPGH